LSWQLSEVILIRRLEHDISGALLTQGSTFRGQYRKAFIACRKHRIDLNALVEHDKSSFLKNIPVFVEQVNEVDYINLFLTSLGLVGSIFSLKLPAYPDLSRGSLPPDEISTLCDAVRVELEQKDLTKYVNSILTAQVVKTPPDYEAGLSLLLRLKGNAECLCLRSMILNLL
jgi:elongator complex protein 1